MKRFLALFLFATTTQAAPAVADKDFVFMTHREYTVEMFRVFQKDKEWFCETEHVPLFKAKGDPLSDLNWNKLQKDSNSYVQKPEACKERIAIVDRREGDPKELKGCLKGAFKDLYKKLSERCRNQF